MRFESWDGDEVISFWSHMVKGQGDSMTECARNTIFRVTHCSEAYVEP